MGKSTEQGGSGPTEKMYKGKEKNLAASVKGNSAWKGLILREERQREKTSNSLRGERQKKKGAENGGKKGELWRTIDRKSAGGVGISEKWGGGERRGVRQQRR